MGILIHKSINHLLQLISLHSKLNKILIKQVKVHLLATQILMKTRRQLIGKLILIQIHQMFKRYNIQHKTKININTKK